MFAVKLLANSGVVSNCSIVLNMFEHVFHISYFTDHLRYYIIDRCWKLLTLCYVYVQFKQANQSCSPSNLVNQSMLNGALVIEMVNNSFSENKKNFGPLIKWGTF